MQNIFIDILPPWVETGLQPAFYDLESGTVLQQTARMYAKVIELTEAFNTFSEDVSETVTDYITQFTELHDYVHDYFDNLDVQEEINNKLDEMAEQGILADIISQYLNSTALFGYDTVADMKTAENLTNGSFAKTLGYYAKNDKGGATYKIRTITNDDVIDEATIIALTNSNTLIAELIKTDEMNTKQFGIQPSSVVDTHDLLQIAINYCDTLIFEKSTYLVNSTLELTDNKHLKLNGATILSTNDHIIHNFKNTDEYLGYNGNGSITIENGTITGGCVSLIHGKDISIKNINFEDTSTNHFIELCACKNVTVDNCTFVNTGETINQGCVNLDPCEYANFPWFDENNQTYDNTVDDNIIISNCKFENIMRGIDSHGETIYHHTNIQVYNNYINATLDSDNCDGIEFFACDNSEVHDNIIKCYRYGVMMYGDNVSIHDNQIIARKSSALPPVYVYKASANIAVYNNKGTANNIYFKTNCIISPNLSSISDVSFVRSDKLQDVSSSISPSDDDIEVTGKFPYTSFNKLILMFGYPTGGNAGTLRTVEVTAFWDNNGFVNTQLYSLDELESGAKLHFLSDNRYRIENTTQTLRTSFFVKD